MFYSGVGSLGAVQGAKQLADSPGIWGALCLGCLDGLAHVVVTRWSHRQDPTWVGSTPDFSGSGAKGRWEYDSRQRKTGQSELWRDSQEVRKAESELKGRGQGLLVPQGHRASQETCADSGGKWYAEAQPRDPAGPPDASVVLTDRVESPESSSQRSSRGQLWGARPGPSLPGCTWQHLHHWSQTTRRAGSLGAAHRWAPASGFQTLRLVC